MALTDVFKRVEDTGVAAFVRENPFAFPTLEAIHVVSIMLVVGSIAMLDLRLLGVSSRNLSVTKLSDEVLPWTWASFVVSVISGVLLGAGQAGAYATNLQFQMKMVLMALAGINLAIFHFFTWRTVERWNNAVPAPAAARIAGMFSLIFWIGVVVCGRCVGVKVTYSPV
jgi:hypothetical protein